MTRAAARGRRVGHSNRRSRTLLDHQSSPRLRRPPENTAGWAQASRGSTPPLPSSHEQANDGRKADRGGTRITASTPRVVRPGRPKAVPSSTSQDGRDDQAVQDEQGLADELAGLHESALHCFRVSTNALQRPSVSCRWRCVWAISAASSMPSEWAQVRTRRERQLMPAEPPPAHAEGRVSELALGVYRDGPLGLCQQG